MTVPPRSLKDLFLSVLEVAPADRGAWMDRECGGDSGVRRQLNLMLAAHDAPQSLLDQPVTIDPGATLDQPLLDQPGAQIGPYKLLHQIGEGGMGVVYVAEQKEPVRRKVALKIIKPGMDTRQVIARFETERQVLAMMDHPNIAKVLDGGVTAMGLPFFVMELVHGAPLTRFCDEMTLSLDERLELFVTVCQAVQHAHQKGIIHRDLKPANILVTLVDGTPVPKVIDFGVAKATTGKFNDQSLSTQFGSVIGTLEYMSPEQAGFSSDDIDTRADIFSLGVILYELMTGLRPIDRVRLEKAALTEMIRIIREEEPSRPSTRLSTDASLPSLAALRKTDPKRLANMLRGELDWVIMKCLEKRRDRRYETANGLARDIQRYLADEPVEARPPSAAYRFQKFVQRHKGQAIAASLVLLALVGGIVGTSLGLIEARRQAELARQEATAKDAALIAEADQRLRAEQNEQKAREQERYAKDREAETSAVLEFVENKIFAAALPKGQNGGLGVDVKLEDAVRAALSHVETSFADQPLIEARLRLTLGQSFLYLGKPDIAVQQLDRARGIYKTALGPTHLSTFMSLRLLALSYSELGRDKEAREMHEDLLSSLKKTVGLKHPETIMVMHNLAAEYLKRGQHAEALKLFEETLKLKQALYGAHDARCHSTASNIAGCYVALGQSAKALEIRQEMFNLAEARFGRDHAVTLSDMHNLAAIYREQGRFREALELFEETLTRKKKVLGLEHPHTLLTMVGLANAYAELGQYAKAFELHQQAWQASVTKFGADHHETLMYQAELASAYGRIGQPVKALELNRETWEKMRKMFGPDNYYTIIAHMKLANSYTNLGQHAEALPLHEEALKRSTATNGPEHPLTIMAMSYLATQYAKLERTADAAELFEKTLKLYQETSMPADHPEVLDCRDDLAACYRNLGRAAEALPLLEESLRAYKTKLGPDHPATLARHCNLAHGYGELGRNSEARELLEQARQHYEEKHPRDPNFIQCQRGLAVAYANLGQSAQALATFQKAMELAKTVVGAKHPFTIELLLDLAKAQSDLIGEAENPEQAAEQAVAWLRQAVDAGFRDAALLKTSKKLEPLQERADFQKLVQELE